jgi:hypothetical protein
MRKNNPAVQKSISPSRNPGLFVCLYLTSSLALNLINLPHQLGSAQENEIMGISIITIFAPHFQTMRDPLNTI